ncbi:MAG: pyridoxal phosphate-dependent aminotransferase [Lachnospiraceae bacterium]|nr:pyridoxal phosphate-dependent aminotransferase [Lachnospiraceae bacterium]
MKYNFDEIIDRRGTMSIKYDFTSEKGMREDVIPMWVADMDFPAPRPVIERLLQVAAHGIFGYSEAKTEYYRAVQDWYEKHFNWHTEPSWLVRTPGVVFAINCAIRAFTNEGDAVLIQPPVYYPFRLAIQNNARTLVTNPLLLKDGHYEIDFADFEEKIRQNHVKLFILCSPHNPVGRVWKEWELRRMADICIRHDVLIISDEIHSDFVWDQHTHHMLASLDERYLQNSVTATAPSKTFNIAGLQVSNILIPNPQLRARYQKSIDQTGLDSLNVFGLNACIAAYTQGEEWLTQLKAYLAGNISFMQQYLQENLPQLKMIPTEGTYLTWVDFRELGLSESEREDLIINDAGLWLDSGAMFGSEGEGFERFNIACPRSILKQALEQLKDAIQEKE